MPFNLKKLPINVNLGLIGSPVFEFIGLLSVILRFRLLEAVEEGHGTLLNGLKEVDFAEANLDLKGLNVNAGAHVGIESSIFDEVVVCNTDAARLEQFLYRCFQEFVTTNEVVFIAVVRLVVQTN